MFEELAELEQSITSDPNHLLVFLKNEVEIAIFTRLTFDCAMVFLVVLAVAKFTVTSLFSDMCKNARGDCRVLPDLHLSNTW